MAVMPRNQERLTGKHPFIKWVNDIYLNGKKICGILCQRVSEGGRNERVIIGIGINVIEPESGFPEQIKRRAGAIFPSEQSELCQRRVLKIDFAAETVNEIYGLFEKNSEQILSEYKSKMFLLAKKSTFLPKRGDI